MREKIMLKVLVVFLFHASNYAIDLYCIMTIVIHLRHKKYGSSEYDAVEVIHCTTTNRDLVRILVLYHRNLDQVKILEPVMLSDLL
jgi:hypothetical protein